MIRRKVDRQAWIAQLLLCYGCFSQIAAAVAQGPEPGRSAEATKRTDAYLVSTVPCPDPYVFHDGTDWYIFGTGAEPFFLQGNNLEPAEMRKVKLDLDLSSFPQRVHHIWGFVVFRNKDEAYHAYGTLHLGDFHTVIAHFVPGPGAKWTAGKPITRWRIDKILLGDPSKRDWDYYESKVVCDEDCTLYLVYVTRQGRDNHIMARRLGAPDRLDPTHLPATLLKPSGLRSEDRNEPGSMQLVEGPSIARYEGKYILFYSVGDFARNNYKLGVAFSDRIIPPDGTTYQKVLAYDPRRTWGPQKSPREIVYVMQSQVNDWPNNTLGFVNGPGLGSLVYIDSRPWLVFHGYRPSETDRNPDKRYVFKLPLEIRIRGKTPTAEWVSVKVPSEPKAQADPGARR
jgi:hypothetical protein